MLWLCIGWLNDTENQKTWRKTRKFIWLWSMCFNKHLHFYIQKKPCEKILTDEFLKKNRENTRMVYHVIARDLLILTSH